LVPSSGLGRHWGPPSHPFPGYQGQVSRNCPNHVHCKEATLPPTVTKTPKLTTQLHSPEMLPTISQTFILIYCIQNKRKLVNATNECGFFPTIPVVMPARLDHSLCGQGGQLPSPQQTAPSVSLKTMLANKIMTRKLV
jgi:hypothetical protein